MQTLYEGAVMEKPAAHQIPVKPLEEDGGQRVTKRGRKIAGGATAFVVGLGLLAGATACKDDDPQGHTSAPIENTNDGDNGGGGVEIPDSNESTPVDPTDPERVMNTIKSNPQIISMMEDLLGGNITRDHGGIIDTLSGESLPGYEIETSNGGGLLVTVGGRQTYSNFQQYFEEGFQRENWQEVSMDSDTVAFIHRIPAEGIMHVSGFHRPGTENESYFSLMGIAPGIGTITDPSSPQSDEHVNNVRNLLAGLNEAGALE
jgi:hypothetical protein